MKSSLRHGRWFLVFATVLLWMGVLVCGGRTNPFNVITTFFTETLICLGVITLGVQYTLRNRRESWLTATFVAAVVVALAQWLHVI